MAEVRLPADTCYYSVRHWALFQLLRQPSIKQLLKGKPYICICPDDMPAGKTPHAVRGVRGKGRPRLQEPKQNFQVCDLHRLLIVQPGRHGCVPASRAAQRLRGRDHLVTSQGGQP